jgi:hypothetical protein
MSDKIYKLISAKEIKAGMTVVWQGKETTVCTKDISYSSLMGQAFRGDASKKQITQIIYKVPTINGNYRYA